MNSPYEKSGGSTSATCHPKYLRVYIHPKGAAPQAPPATKETFRVFIYDKGSWFAPNPWVAPDLPGGCA